MVQFALGYPKQWNHSTVEREFEVRIIVFFFSFTSSRDPVCPAAVAAAADRRDNRRDRLVFGVDAPPAHTLNGKRTLCTRPSIV